MEYAIVESGGKQYKAIPGTIIEVDRLPVQEGEKVELDRVLLISDGETVTIGTPTIPGASVQATALAQVLGPKVVVFKYKPKIRYRKKSGHRHRYTQLQIDAISIE